MSDFFDYYKKVQDKKEQIAIMEDYFNNSEDFKMDCTPLQLEVRN